MSYIYQKIRQFFISLVSKKDKQLYLEERNKIIDNSSDFIENIKNIENDETKLLKLQKSLKSGAIKISDLTLSEINVLNKLYANQNEILKKKIENHKVRILKLKQQVN